MKINRVILSLDGNPTYSKFWNVVAPIWDKFYDIKPTLIFVGNETEMENVGIEKSEYDIFQIEINNYKKWSVTWANYWLATKFPDEVCLICGIDDIPLNYDFFDKLKEINDDKFVIGLSDAYKNHNLGTLSYYNTKTNILYPSGYNVGKGNLFKKILNIHDDLEIEIEKLENKIKDYSIEGDDFWGLDECYFSEVISNYEFQSEIVYLNEYENFGPRRCFYPHDLRVDLLKDGYYSQFTNKNVDINTLNNIVRERFYE